MSPIRPQTSFRSAIANNQQQKAAQASHAEEAEKKRRESFDATMKAKRAKLEHETMEKTHECGQRSLRVIHEDYNDEDYNKDYKDYIDALWTK